jgi:hypothetical protein
MSGNAELKQTVCEFLAISNVVDNQMTLRGAGKSGGYDANVRDAVAEIPGDDDNRQLLLTLTGRYPFWQKKS